MSREILSQYLETQYSLRYGEATTIPARRVYLISLRIKTDMEQIFVKSGNVDIRRKRTKKRLFNTVESNCAKVAKLVHGLRNDPEYIKTLVDLIGLMLIVRGAVKKGESIVLDKNIETAFEGFFATKPSESEWEMIEAILEELGMHKNALLRYKNHDWERMRQEII